METWVAEKTEDWKRRKNRSERIQRKLRHKKETMKENDRRTDKK
jgi:hypothetical protein